MVIDWLYPEWFANMAVPPMIKVFDAEEHGLIDDLGRVNWTVLHDLAADYRAGQQNLRVVTLGFVSVDRPIRENNSIVVTAFATELYDIALAAAQNGFAWDIEKREPTLEPILRYLYLELRQDSIRRDSFDRFAGYVDKWLLAAPDDEQVINANIAITMARLERTLVDGYYVTNDVDKT